MKERFLLSIQVLLILLFSYTAVSKLVDINRFIHDLNSQPFGKYWSPFGRWALPAIELIAAALLVTTRFRNAGLWLSFILMAVFSVYILLILSGVFPKRPCSCAGVFKEMGWGIHFLFNLFFLGLAWIGIRLTDPNRSTVFFNQKQIS
jgi:putative oxidoreductase